MEIKSQISNSDGSVVRVIYNDTDSFENLLSKKVTQVYGACFIEGKMLVVHNKNSWGLVGGGLEVGETYEECLKREIEEESNMKVVSFAPIGYQEVQLADNMIYQLRYACLIEPYGEFISDPDGDVTEIKLIDPLFYKEFFDWGEIGERIIARALELKNELR